MFSNRHHLYEKYRCLRGGVVTLEGLIGVGKTSCGNSLASFLNDAGLESKFFPEYRNDMLLDQYISNMDRYSFSFQLFMLAKRAEIYREAQRYAKTGAIAIIDRSIVGDWAFAYMQFKNGKMSEQEWDTYQSMVEQEKFPEPSYTVYLQCTPNKALSRTKKRGIPSEQKYVPEYFEELLSAYDNALSEVNHPLVKITWENDRILPMGKLSHEDCEYVLNYLI